MPTVSTPAVMIAELGSDLRFTYANDAYAKLYGLDPSAIVGKHPRDLMSQAIFSQVGPKLEAAKNGAPFKYQLDLRSVKSGPDYVEVNYQPEQNPDGSLKRIHLIVSDLTDHRASVSTAETVQARLAAAHQLSPDGFMVFSSILNDRGQIIDFRWEYSNEAGGHIARRKVNELIGSKLLEELPGNKEEGLFQAYVEVVETGEPFKTTRHYEQDGLDVWLYITAIKLGDGFAVSFSDVTTSKLQEIELQENKRRLEVALEASQLGVWDLDPYGKTSTRSLRHDEIFGYPDGVVQWSQDEFTDHLAPEDRGRIEKEVGAALLDSQGLNFEARITAATGEMKWINVHSHPILDEAGKLVRLIGTIADVTEEKEAELHRNLLVSELNHRVKNSLATIQAIAKQTMRVAPDMESFVSAFTGRLRAISAAHDIVIDARADRADIATMIEKQVRPYAILEEQLFIEGETVMLTPESSHSLGLVLHEMATNAAKYGALSKSGGRVRISYHQSNDGETHFTWSETGGPPVKHPKRKGFGSRLIRQCIEHSLGGCLELKYDPKGFSADFSFPENR